MKKTLSSLKKTTRKWHYTLMALFLLTGAFFLAASSEAQAAPLAEETPGPGECSNLDVIFLVDQSASMGGLPPSEHALGNDPTLQRKYAVEGMIDMLVDLTIGQCPDSYHRIGIISFGDEAQVDLPFSIISPADSTDAIDLRERLKASVQATNLGATNTWDAFREAKRMFDNAGPTPAGTDPRKRVVILITDGYPCLDAAGCPDYQSATRELYLTVNQFFPFADDLLTREDCLKQLREEYEDDEDGIPDDEINNCLLHEVDPDSYEASTYVWTVLLKDEDEGVYPRGVLENLEEMSEEHAGQMIQLSQNRGDIPAAIREILSYLAGVRPRVLECGNFAVNPYLQRMVVNTYGIDEASRISLSYQDANGDPHVIPATAGSEGGVTVSEYYQYGTNERYVIEFPYPGLWSLTSQNCAGLDVYYDPVQVDPSAYSPNLAAQLPQHDLAPYYDEDRPDYLEYQLKQNTTGAVIPQADIPQFDLNVNLTVTDPNGNVLVYPMAYVASEQRFRSSKALEVATAGVYTIHISGTSMMHEGTPVVESTNLEDIFNVEYTVFENEDVTFTVFPVQPFVINVMIPQAGGISRPVHTSIFKSWLPLDLEPFPVRIRITDRQGNTLTNLSEMFVDSNGAFRATVSSGSASAGPITLQPDPNIPGEFVAEFPGADLVGEQTLTVESVDAAIHEQYVPDDRKVEVPFTRAEYLWTMPAFYNFMAGLLIAIFLISIFYNIAIRTNKVNGTLCFEDGGASIAEFGLYNGKNTKKIGARALSIYPQLFLKKIAVQNAGKKRKAKKPVEDDALAGGFGLPEGDEKAVRVTLTTSGGRKFSMDLMPNFPTSFGDETPAQMVYKPIE